MLSALATVTDKIGLAATLNTTFNEPYELARQFATLDHLSPRSVPPGTRSPHRTTFTWRQLPTCRVPRSRPLRYERAAEFIATAKELWDSWDDGAIVADRGHSRFLRPARIAIHMFDHVGDQFQIHGLASRALRARSAIRSRSKPAILVTARELWPPATPM